MKIWTWIEPSKHLVHMYSCFSVRSWIKPPDEDQVRPGFDLLGTKDVYSYLSVRFWIAIPGEDQVSD